MKRQRTRAVLMIFVTLSLLLLWWGLDTTLAQGPLPSGPQVVPLGYSFTYQGRLNFNGVPANGPYDLRFSVWNQQAGGIMLGTVMTFPSLNVDKGLFSVELSPGAMDTIFMGAVRWLQIEVRPGGSVGAYTALTPRQTLTPTPYAWGLMPGASITSTPVNGWEGWVMRVDMTGTFPLASGVMANAATGAAVRGRSEGGSGIVGTTNDGYAVYGYDGGTSIARGYGGYFVSDNGVGLYAQSNATRYYNNMWAPGIYARSADGVGLYAVSDSHASWIPAIYGVNNNGIGVSGLSPTNTGIGVQGWAGAPSGANRGVYGGSGSTDGHGGHFINISTPIETNQVGMWAGTYWGNIIEGHDLDQFGNSLNRRFVVNRSGNVYADGSYNCGLAVACFNAGIGADVAERIQARGKISAGDVVEIDPSGDEEYRLSSNPNSTRVAGVASTNPAVTLGNNDMDTYDQTGVRSDGRPLLALVGQVPVKVTDENGAIQPGDLLVSSSTPGHAMKAPANPPLGAVIGKALQRLEEGTGVIKMLVMLR